MFSKMYVDIMFMLEARGYCYTITIRDELTHVAEERTLRKANTKSIANFSGKKSSVSIVIL